MVVRLAMLAAFVSATACVGASSTGLDPITCPPAGSTLTYANFGDEMIANKCTNEGGCHSRQRPIMLTQTAIQQNTSSIMDNAVYTDAMPKSGSMTLEERKQLGEWLACGAP